MFSAQPRPGREQPKRSGVDISMKHLGWKCCLLMTMVLAAIPSFAQQAPASSATGSSAATGGATPATSPQIPKDVNDKLAQLDQRVTAAQSSAALTSIHALSPEDCAAVTRWSSCASLSFTSFGICGDVAGVAPPVAAEEPVAEEAGAC